MEQPDLRVVGLVVAAYCVGVLMLAAFCIAVYVALHMIRMKINKEVGLYQAHNAYRPARAERVYRDYMDDPARRS